eukprot:1774963-Prorocentrum_lima.AAC.1
MTSSLVGSEMCIRDRVMCDSLEFVRMVWTLVQELLFERSGPYHQAGTVSYTHLTLPTICSV